MTESGPSLSRRTFLKLAVAGGVATLFPQAVLPDKVKAAPAVDIEQKTEMQKLLGEEFFQKVRSLAEEFTFGEQQQYIQDLLDGNRLEVSLTDPPCSNGNMIKFFMARTVGDLLSLESVSPALIKGDKNQFKTEAGRVLETLQAIGNACHPFREYENSSESKDAGRKMFREYLDHYLLSGMHYVFEKHWAFDPNNSSEIRLLSPECHQFSDMVEDMKKLATLAHRLEQQKNQSILYRFLEESENTYFTNKAITNYTPSLYNITSTDRVYLLKYGEENSCIYDLPENFSKRPEQEEGIFPISDLVAILGQELYRQRQDIDIFTLLRLIRGLDGMRYMFKDDNMDPFDFDNSQFLIEAREKINYYATAVYLREWKNGSIEQFWEKNPILKEYYDWLDRNLVPRTPAEIKFTILKHCLEMGYGLEQAAILIGFAQTESHFSDLSTYDASFKVENAGRGRVNLIGTEGLNSVQTTFSAEHAYLPVNDRAFRFYELLSEKPDIDPLTGEKCYLFYASEKDRSAHKPCLKFYPSETPGLSRHGFLFKNRKTNFPDNSQLKVGHQYIGRVVSPILGWDGEVGPDQFNVQAWREISPASDMAEYFTANYKTNSPVPWAYRWTGRPYFEALSLVAKLNTVKPGFEFSRKNLEYIFEGWNKRKTHWDKFTENIASAFSELKSTSEVAFLFGKRGTLSLNQV